MVDGFWARAVLAFVTAGWLVSTPAGAEPLLLAYKAGGPHEFWIRTTVMRKDSRPAGIGGEPSAVDTVDVLSLVSQKYTADATGALQVELVPKQHQGWANGEEAGEGDLPPEPRSTVMLRTGENPGVPITAEGAMAPIFPAKPIDVGHSWSVEVLPSEKLPAAMKITHTFEKIEKVGGHRCARIASKGATKGNLADGTGVFAVKMESTTLVSLDDGQTVRTRGETRTLTKRTPRGLAPFKPYEMKMRVVRAVQRKTPADAAPPDAPEKSW